MILKHTCLGTFDEVAVHLDSTQTEYLVEAHRSLLHVERLGQIVIGRDGDILRVHILWREHTLRHQYELNLLRVGVRLQLVTEFTTRHDRHLLLTDDDVALHLVQIVGSLFDVVVDMEVVDIFQSG